MIGLMEPGHDRLMGPGDDRANGATRIDLLRGLGRVVPYLDFASPARCVLGEVDPQESYNGLGGARRVGSQRRAVTWQLRHGVARGSKGGCRGCVPWMAKRAQAALPRMGEASVAVRRIGSTALGCSAKLGVAPALPGWSAIECLGGQRPGAAGRSKPRQLRHGVVRGSRGLHGLSPAWKTRFWRGMAAAPRMGEQGGAAERIGMAAVSCAGSARPGSPV